MDIWNESATLTFANEADVEHQFVVPLLAALGYLSEEVAPKYPVKFQEGRRGRPHEADLVVFCGSRVTGNALITIEAKPPNEPIDGAKAQAQSYARNLGTPFFVITNGVEIEIWQLQLVGDCISVHRCLLSQLNADRPAIERYIGSDAARAYFHSLRRANPLIQAMDTTPYVTAEQLRLGSDELFVERSLQREGADEAFAIRSDQLAETFGQGGVVVGLSGYGKSTLARQMARQSLSQVRTGVTRRVSFEVWLPDVAEMRIGIAEYMRQRIVSSCPAMTEASFRRWLHDEGAVLICDGFDRLAERGRIETELRTLRRDNPALQLFVFTRPGVQPALELPCLTLLSLAEDQQFELFSKVYPNKPGATMAWYTMPKPLRALCFHPLLLTLVAKYVVIRGDTSVRIGDIFENWLAKLIEAPARPPSMRVKLEEALLAVALSTVDRPISRKEALEVVERRGFSATVFDELLSSDAVAQGTSTIELQHELLADYLRARHVASADEHFVSYLEHGVVKKGSLLPILLMSMLGTREKQRALWQKLQRASLDVYLHALLFRADTGEDFAAVEPQKATEQYLEDLLDGLEGPLASFFPQMRPAAVSLLTAGGSGSLGIRGFQNTRDKVVVYQFIANAEGTAARVAIADVSSDMAPIFTSNLTRSGSEIDSGRVHGARQLRRLLLDVVARRELLGGKPWITERLLGKVRFLEGAVWRVRPRAHNLAALKEHLAKDFQSAYPSSIVGTRWVQGVLNDINRMMEEGEVILSHWWLPNVNPSTLSPVSDDQHHRVLDDHFRRTLLTYMDICEHNLSGFLDQASYAVMPVRWQLELKRGGVFGTSMFYWWTPVRDLNDAGADSTFVEERTKRTREDELDVFAKLRAMNRPTDAHMLSYGSTPIPEFDGTRFNSTFDGETSVLRYACELFVSDIKALFDSLTLRGFNA